MYAARVQAGRLELRQSRLVGPSVRHDDDDVRHVVARAVLRLQHGGACELQPRSRVRVAADLTDRRDGADDVIAARVRVEVELEEGPVAEGDDADARVDGRDVEHGDDLGDETQLAGEVLPWDAGRGVEEEDDVGRLVTAACERGAHG